MTDEEDEDTQCKNCKKKVKDGEAGLFCEGKCQSWYHIGCVAITNQLYRKMTKEIMDLVIWMCDTCKSQLKAVMQKYEYEDNLKKLVEKINDMEKKMEAIPQQIEENSFKPSYATVTHSTIKPTSPKLPSNLPSIVIKPKTNQGIKETKADLEQKIKPSALGIRIKSKKELNNGNIVVKCPTVNEIQKLKASAAQILGENYEILETTLRNPRIKIVGINKDYTKDEMETIIKKQNTIIAEDDLFKVTYIKSFKHKNSKTAYAECSPKIFHHFMNVKKIYLGWEILPVYEEINVTKCFKCQQFHHKTGECKNKVVCVRCSEDHETKECQSQIKKCKNCENSNSKYKTNYDIHHTAVDWNCPSYKYQLDLIRAKINYG